MSALQIHPFLTNKANFRKVKFDVNKVLTKDYVQMDTWSIRKNKAKTNPIQSQSNPIKANKMPKQTQFKPKQTQFQRKYMLLRMTINPRRLFAIPALAGMKEVDLISFGGRIPRKQDFVLDFWIFHLIILRFGRFCVSLSLEISSNLCENYSPFNLLFLLEVCF
jgi:hypothetical protein